MNNRSIISDLIREYQYEPIDLLNLDDAEGEDKYLSNMSPTYIRTLNDLEILYPEEIRGSLVVLEIGSYLGIVSIGLSKLGFKVIAGDLPVFMRNFRLINRYSKYGVSTKSIDLKDTLPFEDKSVDCIILCETLEHLNFNPVPVLLEISRILKVDGYFYLSVPNNARLENRLKLLAGNSINNSVDEYFAQVDPACNFSVGLHWHEYVKDELLYLLKRIGFKSIKHYFFHPLDLQGLSVKFYIRSLWDKRNFIYTLKKLFPSLKENHTIVCRK